VYDVTTTTPALLPRPSDVTWRPGSLDRSPAAQGPAEIVDLAHELMGERATGDYTLAPDDALGAEGYRLTIDATGVRATAPTLTGLRWAVQTVRQLDPELPFVEITDIPRYGWRGALLDVSRYFRPIGFVRRYVDLLAMHKLNTLHLHLTDDQGWRFEVRKYPRLAEVGGFRRESMIGDYRDERFDGVPHGGFYTHDELRDLVAYGARRGVRIMPEIDLPGHMQAAITAYPNLGNDPSRQLEVRTAWGISEHILNCEPETVTFVKDVLDEIVDVFDFEMIHLGGDEVPPTEWLNSESAKNLATAAGLPDVEHLSGWWIRELAEHLARSGRTVAGWDELVDAGAPTGATIFSWRDNGRVAAAQAAGHPVVSVPQEFTYLDWAEVDSPDEPIGIPNGFTSLERVHGYDPGDTLGLQGQLWAEYMPTEDLVDFRAFPRLTAIAETGWSGPGGDFAEFRERLAGHLPRLDALGVKYRPL
jgi:hexosaminidase